IILLTTLLSLCHTRRSPDLKRARGRRARFKQARTDFYSQNTAHRVVEALSGNLATLRLSQSVFVQLLPARVRRHEHVESGVDGLDRKSTRLNSSHVKSSYAV